MLKVNKKTEYALMVLKHLASLPKDSSVSANELSHQFGIPFDTVSKVLQKLNNNNILKAEKGKKGGYSLRSDLAGVSFFELEMMVEGVIQGPLETSFCTNSKGTCELLDKCNISSPMNHINNLVNNYLKNISLSELLK